MSSTRGHSIPDFCHSPRTPFPIILCPDSSALTNCSHLSLITLSVTHYKNGTHTLTLLMIVSSVFPVSVFPCLRVFDLGLFLYFDYIFLNYSLIFLFAGDLPCLSDHILFNKANIWIHDSHVTESSATPSSFYGVIQTRYGSSSPNNVFLPRRSSY